MNWNKLSTIGAWAAGITAIIYSFFKKYLETFDLIIFLMEILFLFTYILSEIMKMRSRYISRKRNEEISMVTRFTLYSQISIYFFALSVAFYLFNDAVLKYKVPLEIVGYLIFFSLGIFIGTQCCIDVIR